MLSDVESMANSDWSSFESYLNVVIPVVSSVPGMIALFDSLIRVLAHESISYFILPLKRAIGILLLNKVNSHC